ncbi:hypothetical protein T4E_8247 [Trichinella pseudospiralis]|uniref:Uncharacterized protein n=1 Tax=Trichinella pseudospiralis TaxID=6337 RepID=A0A0V0XML2_TRIPS|nr:hypothetical protein T4E_8247 [Trichinella pseudospiralis]
MSLSKRVGGRKANSDGDRLEENNKAVVDPLAMTLGIIALTAKYVCVTRAMQFLKAVSYEIP